MSNFDNESIIQVKNREEWFTSLWRLPCQLKCLWHVYAEFSRAKKKKKEKATAMNFSYSKDTKNSIRILHFSKFNVQWINYGPQN